MEAGLLVERLYQQGKSCISLRMRPFSFPKELHLAEKNFNIMHRYIAFTAALPPHMNSIVMESPFARL